MPVIWRRGYFVEGRPFRFEWLPGGNLLLTREIIYWAKDGERFYVPEDTVTDLASIPNVFRSFTSLLGADWHRTARPGVLHDWIYQTGRTTRARADRIFRQALRSEGVGRIAAWLMWAAVRVGGGKAWAKWRAFRGRSGIAAG